MEEELRRLRKELAREQRQREEEQRRREEEQRRREEEQRRREEEQQLRQQAEARATEAEAAARGSQPTTLIEYLQACHRLSQAIRIVTDRSLTTQGDATKPAGRLYPKRIVPWDAFPSEQESIWEKLEASATFASARVFPSTHQMDYVRTTVEPISSENGLRNFARDTVENAVQRLIREAYDNSRLRAALGLRGTVRFESHTNLGQPADFTLDEEMRQVSISETPARLDGSSAARSRERGKSRAASRSASSRLRTRPGGKGGGRADQFCIYQQAGGQNIPAVAIEYKAPHKLTREEIVAGLSGEIRPDTDVINVDGEGFEFLSKRLLAAIVTQCFSYMVDKGVRNGYVFTGDSLIFLRIPDDPSVVYYYACVPNVDVQVDDTTSIHQTAVAQVFTFTLQALAAELPPQRWHREAAALDKWEVEYMDILKKIPETDRKTRDPSAYKPRPWKPFVRSPVRTRSRCKLVAPGEHDSSSDGDGDLPPTPTPQRRSTRSQSSRSGPESRGKGTGRVRQQAKRQQGGEDVGSAAKLPIGERPYCTQECLQGLIHGKLVDQRCPNARYHGKKHINLEVFRKLITQQLTTDDGSDADCTPLYTKGSRGALFKIRLSLYGYTLVAKGMEKHNMRYLRHENRMYALASDGQGDPIPVCMGLASLEVPYYFDGGVYTHMLLLSWAGLPLSNFINRDNMSYFLRRATRQLRKLHELGLRHKDAELRNITYDEKSDRLMWVDLERAEEVVRPPLGAVCPNRKRKRDFGKTECGEKLFSQEVKAFAAHMTRSVR